MRNGLYGVVPFPALAAIVAFGRVFRRSLFVFLGKKACNHFWDGLGRMGWHRCCLLLLSAKDSIAFGGIRGWDGREWRMCDSHEWEVAWANCSMEYI